MSWKIARAPVGIGDSEKVSLANLPEDSLSLYGTQEASAPWHLLSDSGLKAPIASVSKF